MRMLDDHSGVYIIDNDGNKHFGNSTRFAIGEEDVFRFDPTSGVLELSVDEASIQHIVTTMGGYPIAHFVMGAPVPFGSDQHFYNVQEIRSLPRRDGTFFIRAAHNDVVTTSSTAPTSDKIDDAPRPVVNGPSHASPSRTYRLLLPMLYRLLLRLRMFLHV